MFVRFSHNGKVEAPLGPGGIRNRTEPFNERIPLPGANFVSRVFNDPHFVGDYDNSVRCGRGNMEWANITSVINVNAGDTLEVAHHRASPSEWRPDFFENCPGDRMTCETRWVDEGYTLDFNHPGPLIVHLSKVPDGQEVHEYDGSGNWVKIYTSGMKVNSDGTYSWPLYGVKGLDLPRLFFQIPKQTPAGQYLMRMDVQWAGKRGKWTGQMYPSCAQLNIKSDATGALPEGVKIPDIFSPESPGMQVSPEMYDYKKIDNDYEYPGGPLWDGEKLVKDVPLVK